MGEALITRKGGGADLKVLNGKLVEGYALDNTILPFTFVESSTVLENIDVSLTTLTYSGDYRTHKTQSLMDKYVVEGASYDVTGSYVLKLFEMDNGSPIEVSSVTSSGKLAGVFKNFIFTAKPSNYDVNIQVYKVINDTMTLLQSITKNCSELIGSSYYQIDYNIQILSLDDMDRIAICCSSRGANYKMKLYGVNDDGTLDNADSTVYEILNSNKAYDENFSICYMDKGLFATTVHSYQDSSNYLSSRIYFHKLDNGTLKCLNQSSSYIGYNIGSSAAPPKCFKLSDGICVCSTRDSTSSIIKVFKVDSDNIIRELYNTGGATGLGILEDNVFIKCSASSPSSYPYRYYLTYTIFKLRDDGIVEQIANGNTEHSDFSYGNELQITLCGDIPIALGYYPSSSRNYTFGRCALPFSCKTGFVASKNNISGISVNKLTQDTSGKVYKLDPSASAMVNNAMTLRNIVIDEIMSEVSD